MVVNLFMFFTIVVSLLFFSVFVQGYHKAGLYTTDSVLKPCPRSHILQHDVQYGEHPGARAPCTNYFKK